MCSSTVTIFRSDLPHIRAICSSLPRAVLAPDSTFLPCGRRSIASAPPSASRLAPPALHQLRKYPLTHADLVSAHARWPELAPWAGQLQQQWPLALPGCQRLLFNGGEVTLDLWLGDINALIDTFDDSLNGEVDAWF